jgi:hypothetical protein
VHCAYSIYMTCVTAGKNNNNQNKTHTVLIFKVDVEDNMGDKDIRLYH